MSQVEQSNKNILVKTLAISCLAIVSLFIWQGDKGFSLGDEGYLWYGVQRVMLGEVPIRDFMAYDPGRYYWSAALLSIVGDNGIMSVRAAVAVFQALGLFTGLLLIANSAKRKSRDDVLFWLISAVILVVWMFPRHKLFDISLSIFLIGILTFLIRNPIPRRYILTGICVGLIAVFGRNHGMYGAIGSLGVIAWLSIKNNSDPGFLKGVALWGMGVALGFSPIVFMSFFIPGFADAFWESVLLLFEQKATNLPLPVPWPWAVNFADASLNESLRRLLVGAFFMGTLIFGPVSILWVIRQRMKEQAVPPALVAAAFLAIPYAHFAFSRADVSHLAQGIFPLLVGCLVILSGVVAKIKWPLATGLCVASLWVMHAFHPGWYCFSSKQCVGVEISGSNLQIHPGTAADVALLLQLADDYAPNGQAFIATPFWPGAYALLEQKSPMWEIYALFPRSEIFEKKEIGRIKASKPSFALILDWPLDGRDELRFKNTHPLTHQHILNNFESLPNSTKPAYQIYKTRVSEQ